MNLAGLLPGTLILVDPDRDPAIGDIVVVQHYAREGFSAATHIRHVGPVYLTPHTTEPARFEPLPRDSPDVRIAGVVVWSAHRYGSD